MVNLQVEALQTLTARGVDPTAVVIDLVNFQTSQVTKIPAIDLNPQTLLVNVTGSK